jgi:hypothetical protein
MRWIYNHDGALPRGAVKEVADRNRCALGRCDHPLVALG